MPAQRDVKSEWVDIPGTPLHSQHGPAVLPLPDQALIMAVGQALWAAGGEGASFTTPDRSEEPVARVFAQEARRYSPEKAVRARGARWGLCHDITAALVALHPERYQHIFGWALDADAHWRTHSWAWDLAKQRIIEPTPGIRRVYVGAPLSAEVWAAL